ncbi:peptidylprolyl isomerase [uncultured Thomasclavelia sp.]|uniref:peptidylprolyl isomerase n=1 Tax=uncultured Thomasclavelia sp. TaxID=3025759 RepID=UPI0025CDCA93|nr:peptidylprolyl isomerase [uncultured Thomasclavelia sp.]
MKLSKCAAALIVTSFLVTGCSSGSKTVKEDDKFVIASLSNDDNEKNIFADDVFDDIISTASGKSAYFDAVLQQLIDQKFPIDDDMETDADTTIQQIQDYYENYYGDDAQDTLEQALSYSGFESLDEYREYMVRAYQRSNFLLAYVKDNFDEVFDDYYTQASPREASIIKISMTDVENPTEEESAKLSEVTALLQTSKSFDEIATDYSDDENTNQNKGKLGIVDTTSQLSDTYGDDVKSQILALGQDEVSEPIKGSDGYFIVKVTNTDKDSIKEQTKKDLSIDTPLIAYDDYMSYLAFQSYDLEYEDDDAKAIIEEVINDALTERENSRGGTQ